MDTRSMYYEAFLQARAESAEEIPIPDNFGYLFGEPCDVACKLLGVKDPITFRDLWLGIFLKKCLAAVPYPGTGETLAALKAGGARLYLVSSRNRFTAYPMMETPAFKDLAALFLRTCPLLNRRPMHCIICGIHTGSYWKKRLWLATVLKIFCVQGRQVYLLLLPGGIRKQFAEKGYRCCPLRKRFCNKGGFPSKSFFLSGAYALWRCL